MAERMGRLRQKETNKRDIFMKHVERYLPPALLAGMFLCICNDKTSMSCSIGHVGLAHVRKQIHPFHSQ